MYELYLIHEGLKHHVQYVLELSVLKEWLDAMNLRHGPEVPW